MITRNPKQIAREACKEAKRRGVIKDFAVRDGGRATIYYNRGAKTYTDNALDTLAVLRREGFDPADPGIVIPQGLVKRALEVWGNPSWTSDWEPQMYRVLEAVAAELIEANAR